MHVKFTEGESKMTEYRLSKLYELGSMLMREERRLYVFEIIYNNIQCDVIFYRFHKAKGYWTIELRFIKENGENLICMANRATTDLDINEFCDFFRIKRIDGTATVKEIFNSFYEVFNEQVPDKISIPGEKEQEYMSAYIYYHENVDEREKKYLYDLRRTGNRSVFNNDKAISKYPDIYKHFKNKKDYSFCFSKNKEDEVDLYQLLKKLKRRGYV